MMNLKEKPRHIKRRRQNTTESIRLSKTFHLIKFRCLQSQRCWRVVGDCVYVFLLLFIIYFQIANIDTLTQDRIMCIQTLLHV